MSDRLINWYDKVKTQKKPKNKGYEKHYIEPCSMVTCIGGTGCGKSNSVMDFLSRADETFYKIIIFTASTSDEPLYNALCESIPETEIYTDINELPSLQDFPDEENDQEKLIIFDEDRKSTRLNSSHRT